MTLGMTGPFACATPPAMSDIETRRRKLKFRADRRGFRELDLYMQQFTDAHLGGFDERQLDEFEAVLDIPDQHTFDWIMGRGEPPAELKSEVLDLLLSFRYLAPR
jgi:antitoxin CptB